MAQRQTTGDFWLENPEFDIFSIPEEERSFKEVGIHTVIMDKCEFMTIQVHDGGGFTILEHVIPDNGQQMERA